MEKDRQITHFFDRRAADYARKSAAYPWNYFRRQERKKILALAPYGDGEEILEIGCGAGFYTRILKEHFSARITAIEPSREMARLAAGHCVKMQVATLQEAALAGSYRHIFCGGAMEFMPCLESAWKKIDELSSDRAWVLLLYPKCGWRGLLYRLSHRLAGCPSWVAGPGALAQAAARNGFVLRKHASGGWISDIFLFERSGDGTIR